MWIFLQKFAIIHNDYVITINCTVFNIIKLSFNVLFSLYVTSFETLINNYLGLIWPEIPMALC